MMKLTLNTGSYFTQMQDKYLIPLKLKTPLCLLLFMIFTATLQAAVAFDNSTSLSSSSASTLTWSHTSTGTATNGVLFVHVVGSSAMTSATTVTYNGISLYNPGGNTAGGTEGRMFWLAEPPEGTFTVVVTVGGGPIEVMAIAATFTGVNNATEYMGPGGANSSGSSSSYSRSDAIVAGDMIATFAGFDTGISSISVGTERKREDETTRHSSLVTNTGSGTIATTWSLSSGNNKVSYRLSLIGNLTLPVKLLNFNADYLKTKSVRLKWTTATEINNDFFMVERSKDGVNFESVSTVKGAGNSNINQTYATMDESPYEGISYYRLKQTDFDGKYEYSTLVAVNQKESDQIHVYPNPVIEQLNYFISQKNETSLITEVLDASGKTLVSKHELVAAGTQVLSLDFSALPPGTYMLRIKTNDDVFYRKIVK